MMSRFTIPRALRSATSLPLAALTFTAAPLAAQLPPEMAAAIPPDTAVLVTIPSGDSLTNGGRAFLEACGAEELAERHGGLKVLALGLQGLGLQRAPAEAGLATGGPVLVAADAGLGDWLILARLSSSQAFAEALAEVGLTPVADTPGLWTRTTIGPDGTSTVSSAAATRADLAVMAKSEAAVRSALASHESSPLVSALGSLDPGSVTVLVDLAALIQTHRPAIEQGINMVTAMGAMAAAQQQQGGMNAVQIMTAYGQFARKMLDIAVQTDWLRITVTPTAQSLRIDKAFRFAEESAFLNRLSRHIESPLDLAGRLPDGAAFEVTTTFDTDRDGRLLTDMGLFFVRAMAPAEPELAETISKFEKMSLAYYETIGDQMAFAMYPSAGLVPSMVILARSPDPAVSTGLYIDMMNDPAMAQVMTATYGLSSEEVQMVDLGEQAVGDLSARHIRLSGVGAMMRHMMPTDPNAPPPEEVETLAAAMDTIDYWFAHTDDLSVMTMEAEPTMLAEISGNRAGPPAPPAFAAPITAGADLVGCLRLGRMLGWMGNMMPVGAPPFANVSEAVTAREQGIWGSVTMEERGVRCSVVVPSGDIAAVVEAFKSLAQPEMQTTM